MVENKDMGASAVPADRVTDATHGATDGSPPCGSVPTSAGHTPRPWCVVHDERMGSFSVCAEKDGDPDAVFVGIAVPGRPSNPATPETEANARLIAAAPELLDALAISTAFLELEAECHRANGDKGKADACAGQAASNRALTSRATGAAS